MTGKRGVWVALAALAVASLACGGSGPAVASEPDVDCPDGMEPHRMGKSYHGWTFSVDGEEPWEEAGITWDLDGMVCGYNPNENPDMVCTIAENRAWGSNRKTDDGWWVGLWWDGVSTTHVCVMYDHE